MANFNIAIEKTLNHEGGYVNDTDDAGGETKYGISKRSYPDVDIKNLTIENAKAIYKSDYWDKIKGDSILSQAVAESIFDFAVNTGVKTAVKLAQKVANVEDDGVVGNETIKAINYIYEDFFLAKYKLSKIERYIAIIEMKKSNAKYLYGWVKRALK